jgi:AcrR family transcriptional regulator
MRMAVTSRKRQTGDERGEQVLAAATVEFAEHGYRAASTAAIAKRAGISQPYIYSLFSNKLELFLAVHDRAVEAIRRAFFEAARGATDPDDALARMGSAYSQLMEDRYLLLSQLQAFAAAGDPEIGPHVGACFKALNDDVARLSGATPEAVAAFFACGMLINVTLALDLPELSEPLLEHAGA